MQLLIVRSPPLIVVFVASRDIVEVVVAGVAHRIDVVSVVPHGPLVQPLGRLCCAAAAGEVNCRAGVRVVLKHGQAWGLQVRRCLAIDRDIASFAWNEVFCVSLRFERLLVNRLELGRLVAAWQVLRRQDDIVVRRHEF